MRGKNNIVKMLIVMLVTMLACVLLLTITACIPRSMILKQSKVSAQYFTERDPFSVLIGDYVNSMQDNFSDTVLCDIICCIDSKHPFRSAIRAEFVQGEYEQAYEGYYRAAFENAAPEQEYSRYWHGSMVVLRPLLMVMPISAIRILYGALCILIQLAIAALLFRSGKKPLAVCSILALVFIEPHMLFVSLEYSNIFLVASIAEIFVLMWIKRMKKNRITGSGVLQISLEDQVSTEILSIFAAIGVITFFIDFLTTETLTFTLPMLIVIAFLSDEEGARKKGSSGANNIGKVKSGCRIVIKGGLAWICGYAAMFLLKILMIFVVCGREVLKSSIDEGVLRLGGEVREANFSTAPLVDPFARLSGAIWHNIACLYPIKTGEIRAANAYVPTLIILFITIAVVYLLHEKIDWDFFLPAGLIAIVPFTRFLALSNHSYLHFFFTYRALMVTIIVFLLFVFENGIRHLIKIK